MTLHFDVIQKAAVILGALFLVLLISYIAYAKIKRAPIQWSRILSQLVLYVGILLVLGLPAIVLTIFVSVLIVLGIQEIYQAVKIKDFSHYDPLLKTYTQAASFLVPYAFHFSPSFFPLYLSVIVIVLFSVPVITQETTKALDRIARGLACVIFATFLSFIVLLRAREDGLPLCIYLIFLTNVADSAAYLFGHIFGKKKLIPRVSPGKTVEGAFFSLLATLLASLAMKYYLLPQYTVFEMLLSGVLIGITAQMGDLIFSVFKRDVGIKDYGHLIPGHGGILDRFDSLVTSAPLFYYLVLWSDA